MKKIFQGKSTFPLIASVISICHLAIFLWFDRSTISIIILSVIWVITAWYLGIHYDKLKYMSDRDELTGAYNRRVVPNKFKRFVKQAELKHKKIVVFFIDVDDFKGINDKYGHHIGDQILQKVTGVLHHTFGDQECVVRWGGDEFLVLMLCDDNLEMDILKGYLQRKLFESAYYETNITVTISVGYSQYPNDGLKLHDLIVIAGRKMYTNKRSNQMK